MNEQQLWEEFHEVGYNRFTLVDWPLDDLFKNYSIKNIDKLLDVGCGGGFTTNYLKRHFTRGIFRKKDIKVYGIDISKTVIQKAQKQYPNIVFKVCDGRNIPFDDNSFDFIFMHSVTVHIPRRFTKKYIEEFKRVLKPKGQVLIQLASFPFTQLDKLEDNPISYPEFGPEPHIGWPIEKIFDLVLNSGLVLASIVRRYPKVDNSAIEEIKDYWVLLKK